MREAASASTVADPLYSIVWWLAASSAIFSLCWFNLLLLCMDRRKGGEVVGVTDERKLLWSEKSMQKKLHCFFSSAHNHLKAATQSILEVRKQPGSAGSKYSTPFVIVYSIR